MDNEIFRKRLTELRIKKGVSARDMSLSLGLSSGYINNIENGVNMPSLPVFFSICEYLDVTPSEYFDVDNKNPHELKELIEIIKNLSDSNLNAFMTIGRAMKYAALADSFNRSKKDLGE